MKTYKSILIVLVFFSIKVFGWGTTGHRVVAEIAERNLTGKSKRHLMKIIGDQKLAYWANWPDFIKSDTTAAWKEAYSWHFVNVDGVKSFGDFSNALKSQQAPNLYTQIKTLSDKIKNKNTPQKEKEITLRFLIHLVGDLAQPMHVGHGEDRGGNDIKLNFFGQPTNLHSVWDDKLVDFQKYSYTEYADVLLRQPNINYTEATGGTLEDWFYDSYKMADRIYAGSAANANYSFDYNYKYSDLLQRQLLYGGLRLAKILNDVL